MENEMVEARALGERRRRRAEKWRTAIVRQMDVYVVCVGLLLYYEVFLVESSW